MRPTIKFILHSLLVFAFIALATAAFTPMAKAKHSLNTSGSWLVVVDWDAYGNPSIELNPIRLDTPWQCSSIASTMVEYLDTYEPDRRYVMACAHPDDASNLDAVIDSIIEDYRPFFNPGQGV